MGNCGVLEVQPVQEHRGREYCRSDLICFGDMSSSSIESLSLSGLKLIFGESVFDECGDFDDDA